jgi:hypothetical protein
MKTLSCMAVAGLAALLLALPARAGDVPNINKRGKDEKAFAEKVAVAIVKAARTSVRDVSLEKFTSKSPRDGRTDWYLTASFKGRVTKKDYTADIKIHLDTSDKDKWEVLRIEYRDNSKNIVGFNRKNVDAMVDKLNGK